MIIGNHHRLRNRYVEVFFDATSLIELCQEKFSELKLRISVSQLSPLFIQLSGLKLIDTASNAVLLHLSECVKRSGLPQASRFIEPSGRIFYVRLNPMTVEQAVRLKTALLRLRNLYRLELGAASLTTLTEERDAFDGVISLGHLRSISVGLSHDLSGRAAAFHDGSTGVLLLAALAMGSGCWLSCLFRHFLLRVLHVVEID